VCKTLNCDAACEAHGECWEGTCYCNTGWSGAACSERLSSLATGGYAPSPPAPSGTKIELVVSFLLSNTAAEAQAAIEGIRSALARLFTVPLARVTVTVSAAQSTSSLVDYVRRRLLGAQTRVTGNILAQDAADAARMKAATSDSSSLSVLAALLQAAGLAFVAGSLTAAVVTASAGGLPLIVIIAAAVGGGVGLLLIGGGGYWWWRRRRMQPVAQSRPPQGFAFPPMTANPVAYAGNGTVVLGTPAFLQQAAAAQQLQGWAAAQQQQGWPSAPQQQPQPQPQPQQGWPTAPPAAYRDPLPRVSAQPPGPGGAGAAAMQFPAAILDAAAATGRPRLAPLPPPAGSWGAER
jgi:hypothetical protein